MKTAEKSGVWPMILLLAVLVVPAGLAVLRMTSPPAPVEEETPPEVPRGAKILHVKRTITKGEVIEAELIEERTAPAELMDVLAVPAGDRELVLGRAAAVEIPTGQPLLFHLLEEPSHARLSASVRENRRAIFLPLPEGWSASRLIEPGDRVDILSTEAGGAGHRPVTRMLLQGALVIDISGSLPGPGISLDALRTSSAAKTLTVEASPEQAMALVFALHNHHIDILLRNPADLSTAAFAPISGQSVSASALPMIPSGILSERYPRRFPTITEGSNPARHGFDSGRGSPVVPMASDNPFQ